MFVIKKMVTAFILPPGIFILPLMIVGAGFLYKKKWRGGVVHLALGCFIWLLTISPVVDIMLSGLESKFSIPKDPHGDVIILLGGGVDSGAPDLSGVSTPSNDMMTRIVTAVRLQKRLHVPIIVSGGQVFSHGSAEAPVVKRFLADLGIPPGSVIVEGRSRDTFENARFTQEICARRGHKNPILVTSAYHMRRSVMSFKKVGLEVTPCPAGFKSWHGKRYGWNDSLPGDFRDTAIALKEYLGLLFYTFAY